jgi:hypothetical protein
LCADEKESRRSRCALRSHSKECYVAKVLSPNIITPGCKRPLPELVHYIWDIGGEKEEGKSFGESSKKKFPKDPKFKPSVF